VLSKCIDAHIHLEHTQQRLPQVLKPHTEYATFAYVEGSERPPIFLIQEGPLPF